VGGSKSTFIIYDLTFFNGHFSKPFAFLRMALVFDEWAAVERNNNKVSKTTTRNNFIIETSSSNVQLKNVK